MEDQFGVVEKLDFAFLMDQKSRIWLVHKDVNLIDFEKLRINTVGLYFAEINKYGEIRLTMEGSQLVGEFATRNVVTLKEDIVREYFKGADIDVELDVEGNPFVLLKYGGDYFGCAKHKDGKLFNYLPKEHRVSELIL
jgi:NOL1/NOP2/fmu family ribosome biogenesis protein